MKTFKKSLAVLLAILMVFSSAAVMANAVEPVKFAKVGSMLYVYRTKPADLDTSAVEYNEMQLDNISFTKVTVCDDVDTIESGWFSAEPITEITLKGRVTIEDSAFEDCTSLKTVTFNADNNTVGISAFEDCSTLSAISFSKIASVSEASFKNCKALKSAAVEEVPDSVFYGCSGLTTVTLDGVTTIGDSAFYGCSGLRSFVFTGITSIGDSAFYGCTGLESVTIPATVTSVGASAFSGCTHIESVDYRAAAAIPAFCFRGCSAMEEFDIPDAVTSIGESAFAGCVLLESIEIPAKVAAIGESAFEGDKNLEEVVFISTATDAARITEIPRYCFKDCSTLGEIELPTSVKTIGRSSFENCIALAKVTLNAPTSGILNIERSAFFNCPKLTSIKLADNVRVEKKALGYITATTKVADFTIDCSAYTDSDNSTDTPYEYGVANGFITVYDTGDLLSVIWKYTKTIGGFFIDMIPTIVSLAKVIFSGISGLVGKISK